MVLITLILDYYLVLLDVQALSDDGGLGFQVALLGDLLSDPFFETLA